MSIADPSARKGNRALTTEHDRGSASQVVGGAGRGRRSEPGSPSGSLTYTDQSKPALLRRGTSQSSAPAKAATHYPAFPHMVILSAEGQPRVDTDPAGPELVVWATVGAWSGADLPDPGVGCPERSIRQHGASEPSRASSEDSRTTWRQGRITAGRARLGGPDHPAGHQWVQQLGQ